MTDIETIRVLTGNEGISDDFIAFYLNSTEQFIKSYCNIEVVPDELRPTLLEMTALKVNANSNGANAALGQGVKQVGSISDGNQSISYTAGGAGTKTFVSEEDFIAAYGHILNRWRRMVVNKPVGRALGARRIEV
nr:MAG TPA: head to tail adaptor [Caudoviricetes sp.]